jgi:hypothetical protein
MRAVNVARQGLSAAYAAQGVSELGLLATGQNLPGFEQDFSVTLGEGVEAQGSLSARSSSGVFPCPGQGEEWRRLSHNESIQIPLFSVVDEHGTLESIQEFYVEFYVAAEDGTAQVAPVDDVLRWKILGLDEKGKTEAMSEYIPLYGSQNSATQPTLFGTTQLGALPVGYSDGKFFSRGGDFGVYPIRMFVRNHSRNYLILTHVIQGEATDQDIYFRFHGKDHAPVCEYAEVDAQGFTTRGVPTQVNVETLVREGENLPVFDFVIYHTK